MGGEIIRPSFMGKIRNISARLNVINKGDVEAVLLEAIDKNKPLLISMNQSQLQDSMDSDQKPLGEYASISYANLKGRITIDLKLTGKWYDGFTIIAKKFPVIFTSVEEKTKKLVARFGKSIFGLDKVNLSKSNKEVVLPAYRAWLRRLLHI